MGSAMADRAPIRLTWAKLSAIGMRASNQDAIGHARQGEVACFVMSDGAGGHEGGEVASNIVVGAVLDRFMHEPRFGTRALLSYLEHAIDEVARGKRAVRSQRDMCATVVALLIDFEGGRAAWAHLGDTRLYHFRNNRLLAVTKDHSLTQQLIDAGYATADQLRVHPQRNILIAAVGAEGGIAPVASADPVQLEDGDAILVCSDGLWEWVLEEDMERTLAVSADVEAWVAAMCAVADANAGQAAQVRDNYSVYAIRVQRQYEAP